MRLLHLHNSVYHPMGFGGAEVANRGLLEMLVRAGFSVESVCKRYYVAPGAPTVDELAAWEAGWIESIRALGGTVDAVSPQRFSLGGVEVYLAGNEPDALIDRFSERLEQFAPDRVLLAVYGRTPAGLEILNRVVDRCGSRAIYLAHSIMGLPFGPHAAVSSERETELLGQLGGIVAPSRFVADYIRQWSSLAATQLYYPAYNTEPLRSLGTPDGHVTFVNPCPEKGLAIFVEMARALPAVRFVAVPAWGTGPTVRRILAELPNVTLGAPSPSANEFLAGTSVLVMPSVVHEGLGLVAIEAMARGIPVLLSDLGALREAGLGEATLIPVNPVERSFDDTGRAIFSVPPQSGELWVEALQPLLADPEAYRRASRRVQDRARAFIASIESETRSGLCNMLQASA